LLGLEGLAVERVVLTVIGTKIAQLVTGDPDGPIPVLRDGVDLGQGLGPDSPAGPALWGQVRGGAVAQAALAMPHRRLSSWCRRI
jgi:hypothetical protein